MIRRSRRLLAAGPCLALLTLLAGCQSVKNIEVKPTEATLLMPENSPKYRRQAERVMKETFPGGYESVREWEDVLPENTVKKSLVGGTKETTYERGWKITYAKRDRVE